MVLLSLAIAACASPQWHRPGSTQDDLLADQKACTIESGNKTGYSNLYTSRFVAKCLKERGWEPGKAPAVPVVRSDPKASNDESVSFDQCFERCRSLTDRTKEQCFDTCLER